MVAAAISAAMPPAFADDATSLGLQPTGRGHFDQYQSALACNAVLENPSTSELAEERASDIELGRIYTVNFAAFVLESGTIVDPDGTLLGVDGLSTDLSRAHEEWLAVLAEADDVPRMRDRALRYCLQLFGHEW